MSDTEDKKWTVKIGNDSYSIRSDGYRLYASYRDYAEDVLFEWKHSEMSYVASKLVEMALDALIYQQSKKEENA